MELGSIVAWLGGGTAAVAAVFAWISRLATERAISAWRRDENALAETLRVELSRTTLQLQAGISGGGAGQAAAAEARVAAVERLWAGVLGLRESFKGPVFFFGLLMPSEYDDAWAKQDAIAASIADVDQDMIVEAIQPTGALEADRPHLGETLWLRFFIYRAFLGRLAHLIVEGKSAGHIEDWTKDGGIRQLLGHVLDQNQLGEVLDSRSAPLAVNHALNAVEGLILEEMSQVTSGRRSATESFENARSLRAALSDERPGV